MSRNQDTENPFEPSSHLDSNPFENQSAKNPFQHPNDSAFSFDSQDTARGLGRAEAGQAGTGYGYGAGRGGSNAPASSGAADPYAAREADLRRREEELRRRETALGMKENNWPPFFPFIHHNIQELPDDHQPVMKFLYTQWLALIVTLIVNLVGCVLLLISGSSEGGADTAASAGYLPVIGALSFILWYRPIYLGFERTEGKAMAFFFYLYFAFAGCHLLFSIYMAVGIPSTGSAGLINTIQMFSQGHILAAIFCLLASIGWVLQVAGGGLLYKKVWDFKNSNGDITFAEATNQFKKNSITTILLHQARLG
ncbi:scamp family-domain-containing protein [Kockovaella imperatae]|uniref:Scamp family-domain-containing protein n=1 Tax=Kockovaella imperatae TaxID=4999 RepID=A0A1Y1UL31_9TREE|nr:scamp family-domain-containing protein [Kockovaella imperatae]ORX38257.1 scamp family-domain-containing protein [Kockovaella imperatae]